MMELKLKPPFASILCTALLLMIIEGAFSDEYGSYHNSHPPFQYRRSGFSCISQNKRVIWESIVIEVHPRTEDCGIVVHHHQAPELWSAVDRCINDQDSMSVDGCRIDGEYGIVYQINKTNILSNSNFSFPCVQESDIPEIITIRFIYTCHNDPSGGMHPDDDIMTLEPLLPPIKPNSGSSSTIPPPPRADPTMVVDPTDNHTPGNGHIVATDHTTRAVEVTTTSDVKADADDNGKDNQVQADEKHTKQTPTHPITYNELAVIVGPSVAAIAILLLILVLVIVLVKRRNLKLPLDLQGESLFNSRRFSTASQLSDISVNGQQMRTVP